MEWYGPLFNGPHPKGCVAASEECAQNRKLTSLRVAKDLPLNEKAPRGDAGSLKIY